MPTILEDAIEFYNKNSNPENGAKEVQSLPRAIEMAKTYDNLVNDMTKNFTDLSKDKDEKREYMPKAVSGAEIRQDVEKSVRPELNEVTEEKYEETPYKDKNMSDREDI